MTKQAQQSRDSVPDNEIPQPPDRPARADVEADTAPGPDAPPAVAGGHPRMPPGPARYAAVLDQLAEVVFQTDVAGNWTYLNEAWTRMTGFPIDETLGTNFLELVHPDEHEETIEKFDAVIFGEDPFCHHETRYRMRDGSYRWIELRASMYYDDNGAYTGNVGTIIDVQARHRAGELLRLETEVLRALTDRQPLERVLRRIADFVGREVAGLVSIEATPGAPPLPTRHHGVPRSVGAPVSERVVGGGEEADALAGASVSKHDIRAVSGAPLGVLRIHHDDDAAAPPDPDLIERSVRLAALAIERWQALDTEWRLALHDHVTGLPNRALFLSRLDEAVDRSRRHDTAVTLLHLSLDEAPMLAGAHGEGAATELLTAAAARLDDALEVDAMVGRIADQAFAVAWTDAGDRSDAERIGRRLHDLLTRPVSLGDDAGPTVDITSEVSVGIAIHLPGEEAVDGADLLRRADAARTRGRKRGVATVTYDAKVDAARLRRVDLAGQLRTAVRDGHLELHYQPKLALPGGEVVGVEALVRWRHPERGLVSPGEFMPTAERSGVIRDLTHWVLETALSDLHAWHEAGHRLSMAVNLSARLLHDPALPARVERLLEQWSPALEFELTEHVVMTDPQATTAAMRRLEEAGVRFAIDDFGTGYSSLAYLKELPAAALKIDRSFVSDMDTDPRDHRIVRAAIGLAHDLEFSVIAEGVETAAVEDALIDLDCDEAQGFLFARPMPADDLLGWIDRRASRPDRPDR